MAELTAPMIRYCRQRDLSSIGLFAAHAYKNSVKPAIKTRDSATWSFLLFGSSSTGAFLLVDRADLQAFVALDPVIVARGIDDRF
jgi:hypothetical protein